MTKHNDWYELLEEKSTTALRKTTTKQTQIINLSNYISSFLKSKNQLSSSFKILFKMGKELQPDSSYLSIKLKFG